MRALKPLFTAAVFLLAGGVLGSAAGQIEKPSDGSVTFRPHPSLSRRLLVADGVDEYVAQRLFVYRVTNRGKRKMQVLTDPNGPLLLDAGQVRWQVSDLNFDGYLDVALMQDKGGGSYWLFNPLTGLFEFSRFLTDLPNVEANARRQIVTSHLLHHFGYEEYRFRRGQWVMVREVTEEEARRRNGAR